MVRMILMFSRFHGEVIQIRMYDMLDVVESIRHVLLECWTIIFYTKW